MIQDLEPIYDRRHPICHNEWSTVVPGDCENGDNIGKVSYLVTHAEFYHKYYPYAPELEHEDYLYEIIGGNSDGAFAIDSNGELTVANASNFTETRDITVRVKVFEWYFNDCVCTIRRIPEEDCVYFDINVSAGEGDGTRSNPYKSFRDRESVLGNGTPGMSYFWKRGQTFTGEGWQVRNQNISNPYINLAGWGQGERQKIDISDSPILRFLNIGINVTANTENQPIWEDETAHNIRIFDFEFVDNNTNASRYPIQGNPYGQNWEIARLKATNTAHPNGFFWMIGTFFVGYIDKKMKMYDIETVMSTGRQVKFECGGVEAWNFKCYNDDTGNGALVSATTHPFVSIKYIHYTHENDITTSLGMNLRARGHTVEFAVFDVTGWPMVLLNLGSSEGQGSNYNIDESCYFRNVIIKRCGANSLNNNVNQTTNNTIDGARFENIFAVNNGKAFWVNDTAKNLKFRNCVTKGSGSFGIRVWASSGDDGHPVVDNCTILGFTNSFQIDDNKQLTARNTIYDGSVSQGSNTNFNTADNSQVTSDFQDEPNDNYRLDQNSPLVDGGTFISGQPFDIVEVDRPESWGVSIGAFQYIDEPLDGPENLIPPTPPTPSPNLKVNIMVRII